MLKSKDKLKAGLIAALFSITILLLIVAIFQIDIFRHNPYDSYTRQALAWREGRTYLNNPPEELQYLELAIFNGKYYVSFPPVPSVIEFFLTLFFGQNTPNQLMLFIYIVISCVALTLLFYKKHHLITSVLMGITSTLGTNLLSIAVFGGVWHEAQCLSFTLCSLAVLFITEENKILNGLSLFLAALAVGCRPFTVIFIPFLLIELYKKNKRILNLWPYLIAPFIVAVVLMVYNYVRFKNPFEFGHNYLPEFVRSEEGQFSFSYLVRNFVQSIKLPLKFEPEITLEINKFEANIFYIFNPIIALFFFSNLKNIIFRRKVVDFIFPITVLLFVIATCMHKTLGGAQFGARYFIDMIPYLVFYLATQKFDFKYEVIRAEICIVSLAINIYGVYFIVHNFM